MIEEINAGIGPQIVLMRVSRVFLNLPYNHPPLLMVILVYNTYPIYAPEAILSSSLLPRPALVVDMVERTLVILDNTISCGGTYYWDDGNNARNMQPSGMYFIVLTSEWGTRIGKLINE